MRGRGSLPTNGDVQLVDDLVGLLTCLVQETHVGRITNVGRCTSGIGDQLALIGGRFSSVRLLLGGCCYPLEGQGCYPLNRQRLAAAWQPRQSLR